MSLTKIILLFCVLTLSGCATQKASPKVMQLPATSASLFRQPASLPQLEQLFYLNDEQQQDFLGYFHSQEQATYTAEYRLYNYLQNKLMYFTYEGANNSAQLALEQRRGNCMTLALVTSALAKLANIEVGYKVIYQEPLILSLIHI